METRIYQYIGQKVIDDIRCSASIDGDLAKGINKYPQIDFIRSQVIPDDLLTIMKLAGSPVRSVRWLAFSLLRGLEKDERVRAFLRSQWEQSEEYPDRMGLMWRLLDYPDLELSLHERIYAFVKNNWDQWIVDATSWNGGTINVLSTVSSRLSDSSFPGSKKWVYLCASLGSTDRDAVRNLVSSYAQSKASIVSMVVEDLLRMLK